jgi:hypothetical protein
MKFYIQLKDILLGPGKRFDPAVNTEAEVIGVIKKAYGVISSTMDVSGKYHFLGVQKIQKGR